MSNPQMTEHENHTTDTQADRLTAAHVLLRYV